MKSYKELKEEYDRLHEKLVESYAITNDCGWTQEMENELYLTHASSYHRQYLYDDDPDFVEDLEELIRRVKEKIEDNKNTYRNNAHKAWSSSLPFLSRKALYPTRCQYFQVISFIFAMGKLSYDT